MIDETFKVIDVKIKKFNEEKKALTHELELLKNENNKLLIFKSENDELFGKKFSVIDHN